jgi:hypothetical protein
MKWLKNELIPFSVYAFAVVVCIYWAGPALAPYLEPVLLALNAEATSLR